MTDPIDYWERRAKKVSPLSAARRRPVLQWLLSVRIGDQAFVRRQLFRLNRPTVLDVACGMGKMQIPAVARRAYGVDITGFPKEAASAHGYRVAEYAPPDYLFDLSEPVDVITCIDLNAHVAFESFARIIRSAASHATAGGRRLLAGEFDNDSLGYRRMKRSPVLFQRYVLGMKHWRFARDSEFVARFEAAFPQFRRVQRSEIVCVPPLSHFYACFANKDVSGAMMKAAFLVADVALRLLDNLLRLFPASDSALRVGYACERRASP